MSRQGLNGLVAGVLLSLTKIKQKKRKAASKLLVSKGGLETAADASVKSWRPLRPPRARTKCDESAFLKSEKPMDSCNPAVRTRRKAHSQELTRASCWPLRSALVSWGTPIRKTIFRLFHVCFSPLLAGSPYPEQTPPSGFCLCRRGFRPGPRWRPGVLLNFHLPWRRLTSELAVGGAVNNPQM